MRLGVGVETAATGVVAVVPVFIADVRAFALGDAVLDLLEGRLAVIRSCEEGAIKRLELLFVVDLSVEAKLDAVP